VDGSFAAFLAISAVVIVTPGQDTALTIRNTLLGGRAAGVATAAGVAIGQACWTLAASLGLTALIVASEPVFAAIRLLGAAYLIYLGATTLLAALRGARGHGDSNVRNRNGFLSGASALRQGAISNLGNPKMAIFFSSLLPQFVRPDAPAFLAMLGLGLVFVTMTLLWLSAYAAVLARAGAVLTRPRVRRAFDATMGALLVAFGVRLAVAER
jgi:threonine/homoserine/homoserine lactone efflux protein